MTRIHINSIIFFIIMACISGGLMYLLIQNDVEPTHWMFLGVLLKDCILALVWIMQKHAPNGN